MKKNRTKIILILINIITILSLCVSLLFLVKAEKKDSPTPPDPRTHSYFKYANIFEGVTLDVRYDLDDISSQLQDTLLFETNLVLHKASAAATYHKYDITILPHHFYEIIGGIPIGDHTGNYYVDKNNDGKRTPDELIGNLDINIKTRIVKVNHNIFTGEWIS